MTLVLDLTEEEAARLRALAEQQGTDEATALRALIPGARPVQTRQSDSDIARQHSADAVEEDGFLVLTGKSIAVDDWASLLEKDRQARIASF